MNNINIKKVIFIVIAIIAIIAVCISIFMFNHKKDNTEKYATLTSTDNKFSIQIPNNIKYKVNSVPNNDFTIDLYSDTDEMFMYATTIEKARELDLYEVVNDDKTSYFKDKENIRDDTGITKTKINGFDAYEYSLVYYDANYTKDFYCHVVWIETSNNVYVFNFEVKNENSDKYKDIFINIQNSFKEL